MSNKPPIKLGDEIDQLIPQFRDMAAKVSYVSMQYGSDLHELTTKLYQAHQKLKQSKEKNENKSGKS